MKNYKIVAAKIERFKYSDYVKARIYNEIKDLEDIEEDRIDYFVQEAYNWYANDDRISPEDLGLAIYWGWTVAEDRADFESVITEGLANLHY
jgi:hypothetical protein